MPITTVRGVCGSRATRNPIMTLACVAALLTGASAAPAQEVGPPVAPGAAPAQPRPADSGTNRGDWVEMGQILLNARNRGNFPGLAAAIVRSDGTMQSAVLGVRRLGEASFVRPEDSWHLGACGKAMAATVIAMLVEEGKLSWTSTVAQVYPEIMTKIHPDYQAATLEEFLTGRAGIPTNPPPEVWDAFRAFSGSPKEARRMLVEGSLAVAPVTPPGASYLYSNTGWVVAAAMAERVAGMDFEGLLVTKLFEPLGMRSAGFGAPGRADTVDQPRGHAPSRLPIEPGPGADNPAPLTPVGTMHMSIDDWAKFVAFQLRGSMGKDRTLKPESWIKLMTPPEGQDYAIGWSRTSRLWAGGPVLMHDGSNERWFSVVWMAPAKDFAVMVVTNIGGAQVATPVNQTAWDVIKAYLTKVEGVEPMPGR